LHPSQNIECKNNNNNNNNKIQENEKKKKKITGPLDRRLALAYNSDTMKENIMLK
jgi:hypothetical protein